ncbi:unnamed protein product, partial [Laminaria digitata]
LQSVNDLRDVSGTGGVEQALARVADNYLDFLSAHGGRFECMKALQNQLPVPRVDVGRVAAWFGGMKRFPHTDLLVRILSY